MKEIQKLERHVTWTECIHLALMTLCLGIPIALIYTDDPQLYRLAWGAGTVIPVQLVRLFCAKLERKPLQLLSCALLTGLTLFLTAWDHHWVYYLSTLVPILFTGLCLPRHKGKVILTVPSIYALFFPLPFYALGKGLGVQMMSSIEVVLAALITLNFYVYTNQTRLLRDIRLSTGTEISILSIIRQNRRVLAVFALIGVMILAFVPFIITRESPPPRVVEIEESRSLVEESTTNAPTEYTRDLRPSKNLEPVDMNFLRTAFYGTVAVVGIVGIVTILVVAAKFLLSLVEKKRKHGQPRQTEGLMIERLDEEEPEQEKERLSGYEKKLRRRYQKLIRSRIPEDTRISALTPTELERKAELRGPGLETVHELYRKTRYSPEPTDRERYTAFKEAVKNLDPPRENK